MTPQEAIETMQEIYTAAFGNKEQSPYFKAVPIAIWQEEKNPENIRSYKNKLLEKHGPWEYFDKKSLFDPMTDVGFDADQVFSGQWTEAVNKMKDLIKIKIDSKTPDNSATEQDN